MKNTCVDRVVQSRLLDVFFSAKSPHRSHELGLSGSRSWLHIFPPGALVLDIGSGNNPVPRADILADFFIDDDHHRSGHIVDDRPLVACSVERLPFLAKSVDFVTCSHVIEHVANPRRAGDELGEILKAGYIETPVDYGKDILVEKPDQTVGRSLNSRAFFISSSTRSGRSRPT